MQLPNSWTELEEIQWSRNVLFLGIIRLSLLSFSNMEWLFKKLFLHKSRLVFALQKKKNRRKALQPFNFSLNFKLPRLSWRPKSSRWRSASVSKTEVSCLFFSLITIHFKGWKAVLREKSLLVQRLYICERENYISSSFKD